MSLHPTGGLLATVIKLDRTDPVAAREFVRLGLYEALSDQIAAKAPTLQAEAVELIAKQAARARTHLLREHVGKALDGQAPADATASAAGLAILDAYVAIQKGIFSRVRDFVERDHTRGDDGRFVRMNVGAGAGRNMSDEQRHDAASVEAQERVKDYRDQGLIKPGATVQAWFSDDPGSANRNKDYRVPMKENELDAKLREYRNKQHVGAAKRGAKEHFLTGVSVMPTAKDPTGPSGAAFDAMSRFTGMDAASSSRVAGAIPTTNLDGAAANWNNASTGSDRRGYRRMGMTGSALRAVSQEGSNAHMIGGLAQLIGEFGPEAEKVLAPGFQRAAYRYRGTEKRPDATLMSDLKEANIELRDKLDTPHVLDQGAVDAWQRSYDSEKNAAYRRHPGGSKFVPPPERNKPGGFDLGTYLSDVRDKHAIAAPEDVSVVEGTIGHYASVRNMRELNPDQRAMRVRGDVIAAGLVETLPSPKLTRLNQEAGQTPPSQGVMIDSDGRIVSQAVGFNGDHYLPFDLKNLKSLHGGQYVRTRTTGGLTTEDIYTGLLSGARQVQVVSNSGVFTMEFDPDLRGGRRYSDKANKMVERYGRILDAVGNSKMQRQDVSPERRLALRTAAYDNVNWDEAAGERDYKEALRVERAKQAAGIGVSGMKTDDEIALEAEKLVRAMKPKTNGERGELLDQTVRALKTKARESQVAQYKLDGPGYHDALRALQAEFPFYIRSVDYEEMPEFFGTHKLGPAPDEAKAMANDRAYVSPGQNRAGKERAAYHDKAVEGARGRVAYTEANSGARAKGRESAHEEDDTAEASARGGAGASPDARVGAGAAADLRAKMGADRIGGTNFNKIHKDTKTFKDLIAPGGAVARKLANDIAPLMSALANMDAQIVNVAGADEKDEDLANNLSRQPIFVQRKWDSFTPLSLRPRQFTEWLLNAAPAQQRIAVTNTIEKIPDLIAETEVLFGKPRADIALRLAGGTAGMAASQKSSAELITMASPFAPEGLKPEEMATADPMATGLPQPYPGVAKLGTMSENYTEFRNTAHTMGNDKFLRVIADITSKDDPTIAQELSDQIEKHKEYAADETKNKTGQSADRRLLDLAMKQEAWAFLKGERMAKAVAGVKLPDPKVWKSEAPAPAARPLTPAGRRQWLATQVAKADSLQSFQEYLDRHRAG